jgi:hypothetical protein
VVCVLTHRVCRGGVIFIPAFTQCISWLWVFTVYFVGRVLSSAVGMVSRKAEALRCLQVKGGKGKRMATC